MKCPKCGYLGFEEVEQCRNCGYDFSLSPSFTLPELRLRQDPADINPRDDLPLVSLDSLDSIHGDPASRAAARPPAPAPAPVAPARPSPPPARPALTFGTEAELPLCGPPINDDVPLITKASPPRPPLAVRRATPDAPRLRAPAARTPLDLTLDLEPPAPADIAGSDDIDDTATRWPGTRARVMGRAAPRESFGSARSALSEMTDTAGFGPRIAAAALDLLILAGIDALVIYFTLKICGVGLADLAIVPKGPLLAFLLVQNGGYLVAFTVAGQTLGKMAAGIKVIPAESDAPLEIDRALLRTFVWLVLAVPAGLGFLSAFFNGDRRGLHDRFARTRVVRASA
jgi:uncharacterized RDD family membrane protein YckC